MRHSWWVARKCFFSLDPVLSTLFQFCFSDDVSERLRKGESLLDVVVSSREPDDDLCELSRNRGR